MYIGPHVMCRLFLSDFSETWIYSTVFSKDEEMLNLMKIRSVGAELLHADRRTERQTDRHDEANVAFLIFAKAPKDHSHKRHINWQWKIFTNISELRIPNKQAATQFRENGPYYTHICPNETK